MKAFYFNKNSGWTQAETLREALSHTHRAGLRPEDTPFEPRPEGAPLRPLPGRSRRQDLLSEAAGLGGKGGGSGPGGHYHHPHIPPVIFRGPGLRSGGCGADDSGAGNGSGRPSGGERKDFLHGLGVVRGIVCPHPSDTGGGGWLPPASHKDAGAGRAGDSARYRPHFMHSGTICPGKAPGGCVLSP